MTLGQLRIAAATAAAVALWAPASSFGQTASTYDVGITQAGQVKSCPIGGPYNPGCNGNVQWVYTVTNNGPATIPQGVRISIRIEKPEGLRLVYLDTQQPGSNSIQTNRFWQCDRPYGPPGPPPSHIMPANGQTSPAAADWVNCHFITDKPIGKGQTVRDLYVLSEGGVPDRLCAWVRTFTKVAGNWVGNQDPSPPQSNRSCFSSPTVANATYDLDLTTGVTGLSGPTRTWSPSIINIGNGPVPLAPATSTPQLPVPAWWLGRSGFVYRAFIPPGATLQELAVRRGWQCEIRNLTGASIAGPFPAAPVPIDASPHTASFLNVPLASGGSVLHCSYLTGFEMRPLARVGNPFVSAVSFVTKSWPTAAAPHFCSRVEGFRGWYSPFGDTPGQIENNKSCINVSDGQPVNCKQSTPCQLALRYMSVP